MWITVDSTRTSLTQLVNRATQLPYALTASGHTVYLHDPAHSWLGNRHSFGIDLSFGFPGTSQDFCSCPRCACVPYVTALLGRKLTLETPYSTELAPWGKNYRRRNMKICLTEDTGETGDGGLDKQRRKVGGSLISGPHLFQATILEL